MYPFGAKWIGTDISENQIEQAKTLSRKAGMDIDFYALSAENLSFPDNFFDVITACQCFFYFDHEKIMPKLYRMLKSDGRILILYMAWLPYEDKIAGESEKLVLKYNPHWSGAGEKLRPVCVPGCYSEKFQCVYHEEYLLDVPFTRESWNGRMKACRGIGASLCEAEISRWEKEHLALLEEIAPESFCVKHYAAICELKKR